MHHITITKTTMLASIWDDLLSEWRDEDIAISDLPIVWYFSHDVVIEENVTLRDIITQLKNHANILNIVFVSYLIGISIESLYESLLIEEPIASDNDIDTICLLWIAESSTVEDIVQLNMYPTMMALQVLSEEDDDDDTEPDAFYSIRELTCSQLLDTSFILDDIFELYDEADPDDVIYSGTVTWSLYDLIKAVLTDLTTYSLTTGKFKKPDSIEITPMTVPELFVHLDKLDKFFSNAKFSK